jgi:hypothetical protein
MSADFSPESIALTPSSRADLAIARAACERNATDPAEAALFLSMLGLDGKTFDRRANRGVWGEAR